MNQIVINTKIPPKIDDSNILNSIVFNINEKENKLFEENLIKGLEEKDYKFSSRLKLEEFIKNHCTCKFYPESKLSFYYVDGSLFMIKYSVMECQNDNLNEDTIKYKSSYYTFV